MAQARLHGGVMALSKPPLCLLMGRQPGGCGRMKLAVVLLIAVLLAATLTDHVCERDSGEEGAEPVERRSLAGLLRWGQEMRVRRVMFG